MSIKERLTKWNGKKYVLPQGEWRLIAERLAAYENTGLMPEEIEKMVNNDVIMPPKIKAGDLVRVEDHVNAFWREQDIIRQVMFDEHGEERQFAYNMCDSAQAKNVTELYRKKEHEDGWAYHLIWHRPPRGLCSDEGFWAKGGRKDED